MIRVRATHFGSTTGGVNGSLDCSDTEPVLVGLVSVEAHERRHSLLATSFTAEARRRSNTSDQRAPGRGRGLYTRTGLSTE